MRFDICKTLCAAFLLCVATTIVASAQTFTTLASFSGTNGKFPRGMALVQGVDGNFYGTTQYGGANCNNGNRTGCGVVFKVSPTGKLTRLYSFCSLANCADATTLSLLWCRPPMGNCMEQLPLAAPARFQDVAPFSK
jgi:uncharacterized repeat protein (TIGR03803 family)